MDKWRSATQQLNRKFLLSLITISLTIFLMEVMVMLLLDFYQAQIKAFSVPQEAVIDAALMALLCAPLIWFFILRRLVVQIGLERDMTLSQTRLNSELRDALNDHSLVSITNVQGRIIYANKKFCDISGYALEELIGQDHRIVNSGYHDKDYIRTMWQTVSQGNIWQGVFCNRNKQGNLYWVDSSITPLKDENGVIYQYISIRQDITAQKLANEQLVILKRAVNACTDMILLTDANGYIQYVNPALCQVTGWKEEALLGKNPDILDSQNNSLIELELMAKTLQKGESWSGRLLQRRKGISSLPIAGQSLPLDTLDYWAELNISPVMNRDGSLSGFVQIQRDISEKIHNEMMRQMEIDDTAARLAIAGVLQQPQTLANRFSQVLDILFGLQHFDLQSKGGVFLCSPESETLQMLVLRGQFSDDFIQKELHVALGDSLFGRATACGELLIADDCLCDSDHEHSADGMQAHGHYIVPIIATGEVLGVTFLYTTPYPTHSSNRITMLKQVGEMLGIAVLQDRARLSLENARDMAMQAALSKSEFLANMSHEIRTPMNGVLGMLDLLRDTDMSSNQWNLLETAYASAEALLSILNDILDFSKLEAGKVELEIIDFNLATLMEDACALQAGRAHAKQLEISCFIPRDMPTFWQGDPTRIRQILGNLISNAIKFTEHGEVSVSASYFAHSENQHSVRIDVVDTGIGITEHAQGQLFQAFSQAESSTSRRFGGTGLGLSICKKMVELMGGEIGLQSRLGFGSCFWFSLPLQLGQIIVTENPPVDIIGKRVLIVDDNATNCTILHHYLTHWGFIVQEVGSGEAALAELQQALAIHTPYHLLLLDRHMPQMDGLELARILTGIPELTGLPRIMLTSGGLLSDAERRTYGFSQSLLKPVKQTLLFDAILDALQVLETDAVVRSKPTPPNLDFSNKKMLVVEDNKVNQKVIVGMLAKYQVEPELADNGKLAFDKLIENTFDIIFMDCQMPIMDGYQTTRELRLMEKGCGLPHQIVVALTANAHVGEREKCLEAGMDDYLAKPFNQEQLVIILNRWLAQPNNGQQQETEVKKLMDSSLSTWDKKVALQNLAGDEELLLEIMAAFLEEAAQLLAELEIAAAQQDLSRLSNAAHSLKGSLGYLGAEQSRVRASTIENLARNQQSADYQKLCKDLDAEIKRLMAIFRQVLDDL